MPVPRFAAGAHQRNHVAAVVRIGGPDLLTVEQPPLMVGHGARTNTGQVRAGPGLAHADAEERLAAANAGQVVPLPLLGAVTQNLAACRAAGLRSSGSPPVRRY